MYFWNVNKTVNALKSGSISTPETRLYFFLSPLLSIFNGILFGTLFFSHQIVEYSFQDWLKKQHPHIPFYDYWALGLTFLTVIITGFGILLCYKINKKGDNKNFWQRMAYLSFPINFHITFYTLVILTIGGFFGYLFLQTKIALFKENLWPSDQTVNTFLEKTINKNPFVNVTVKAVKSNNSISKVFQGPISFFALPLIPLRIKLFAQDLRTLILMYYPFLSVIPCFLTLLHYSMLYRVIKRISH